MVRPDTMLYGPYPTLDRLQKWARVIASHMSWVTYRSVFIFLALAFLVGIPGESLSSQLSLYPANIVDADEHLREAEHASHPLACRHPLKNLARRRTDTATLPAVTQSLLMHSCEQSHSRLRSTSAATTCRVTPLYQSLQVYRF